MEELNLYDIPEYELKEILDVKFGGCGLADCGIGDLVKSLGNGIVKFRYQKKDGNTLRDAYGTKVKECVEKPKDHGDVEKRRRSVDVDVYTTYSDICSVRDGKVSGIVTRMFINGNLKGMCGKVVTVGEVLEEYRKRKG